MAARDGRDRIPPFGPAARPATSEPRVRLSCFEGYSPRARERKALEWRATTAACERAARRATMKLCVEGRTWWPERRSDAGPDRAEICCIQRRANLVEMEIRRTRARRAHQDRGTTIGSRRRAEARSQKRQTSTCAFERRRASNDGSVIEGVALSSLRRRGCAALPAGRRGRQPSNWRKVGCEWIAYNRIAECASAARCHAGVTRGTLEYPRQLAGTGRRRSRDWRHARDRVLWPARRRRRHWQRDTEEVTGRLGTAIGFMGQSWSGRALNPMVRRPQAAVGAVVVEVRAVEAVVVVGRWWRFTANETPARFT